MTLTKHYDTGLSQYNAAIALLGGDFERAQPIFDALWQSGLQPRRYFHTPEHYLNVAGANETQQRTNKQETPFNNSFEALRFKAGCDHDAVYVQVDRKGHNAIVPDIRSKIERFAKLSIAEDGCVTMHYQYDIMSEQEKRLITALNIIFQHPTNAQPIPLKWFISQNETLSALFAVASGLELGLTEKQLLAEMALIEATVPFGAQGRLPALKERLHEASALWQPPLLSNDDIEHIMVQAEALSNTDVGDFQKPFEDFSTGSFKLLLENSTGRVSATDAAQIDPVRMATAMIGMADFLSAICKASQETDAKRCVFHCVDGSRHPQELRALANIQMLDTYLRAASTDLQLLNDLHTKLNYRAPRTMAEIFETLGVPTEQMHSIPAEALFCALGHAALNGKVASPDNAYPALSSMQQALVELHDTAKTRINQGSGSALCR